MFNIDDYYSSKADKTIYEKLEILFSDWKKCLSKNLDSTTVKTLWNSDGIFPGYSKSKFKILFIGRENRTDYVNSADFKKIGQNLTFQKINEWRADDLPNRSQYWKRIVRIVYGTKNEGKIPLENVPEPNEVLKEMCEKNDYGFAHIEISKFANPSEDGGTSDVKTIRTFLENTDLTFISKEIEIINPDLIITLNLWDNSLKIQNYLSEIFTNCKLSNESEKGKLYKTTINNKVYNIMDIYHLTAHKTNEEYYNPIMKAYKSLKK